MRPDLGFTRVRSLGAAALRLAWRHAGLLGVLAIALADRVALFRWWKAFPGGDTYNFILIAQELLRGSYPVAEKRLPVYPLLLLLARPFADWEAAAIAVAITASLASLVFLYAIGRTLGLSKVALLVALLLFEAAAPFLFQSIRGYADTTFVALTLATILALLRARTLLGALGTGALLGAASLARPEGIVLIPTIAALALVRLGWRRALAALAIAALCWTPFLAVSVKVGRPLLPKQYLTDAEATAFGAVSVREVLGNVWGLWRSAGVDRLWGEPLRILRDLTATAPRDIPPRVRSFLTDPKELPSLLLLAGTVSFALRGRGRAAAVLLPYVALSLPIAWWGVRQRFLVSLLPAVFCVIAAGTDAALRGARRVAPVADSPAAPVASRASRPLIATRWIAPALLLALAAGPWRANNVAEQREVIAKNNGKGYAYYQAIQAARRLPGRIAFDHRSSIALALFGEPGRGRAVFADTHLAAADAPAQWDALTRWNVHALVVPDEQRGAFPVLDDPGFADRFSVIATFERLGPRGRTARAAIYKLLEDEKTPPGDSER